MRVFARQSPSLWQKVDQEGRLKAVMFRWIPVAALGGLAPQGEFGYSNASHYLRKAGCRCKRNLPFCQACPNKAMAHSILFLDQYGSLGGGQQVLLELVRAALSFGRQVAVLIPEGSCATKLRELGATVCPITECQLTQGKKTVWDMAKLALWNLRVFAQRWRLLRRAGLVYVNGVRLLPVAMLAQRLLGKHAVCHVHLNHGARELRLVRRFLRHPLTSAVVVPSPFIGRQLRAFDSAFACDKVKLVENGLDARFEDVPFEDRLTGRNLCQIAVVGRVTPEKGQDVLIGLARLFPDMTFHVLGDAAFSHKAYYEELKARSPANIRYHGWVEDIPAKVRELGIQLCLSPTRTDFEAAPLVPLQMAALSCLVLVRRCGGLADAAAIVCGDTFGQDEELPAVLESLRQSGMQGLAQRARKAHAAVLQGYGNRQFQARLADLLKGLPASGA